MSDQILANQSLVLGADADELHASSDWNATLRIGHLVVFVLLGGFILWASMARLDGAAVAVGLVESESNRKTVQHFEGGIVKELLVRNGDYVDKDQLLVRLDPLRSEAQNDLYKNQLAIVLAQEARLVAEYELRDQLVMPQEVIARSTEPSVAPVVLDQTRMFQSRRDELVRNLGIAQSEIVQAQQDIHQNKVDLATAIATLDNLAGELNSLIPLYKQQLVAMSRITSLEREQLRLQGVIDGAKIQAVKLAERLAELQLKKTQVQQDYQKDASTTLIDVRKTLSDVRQQIVMADDSQKRTEIRAPIAGTVQQMKFFTVGGVVRPGDAILDLVPANDELVVRAQVPPDDVDRISPNMSAELKFPAFNYWGDKAIRGTVRSISRDRIVENEGKTVYFAAEIVVDRSTLPPYINSKLLAGMTSNVIISTGPRTVADYLIRPLVERFDKSMRER
jgi:HlyD family type I secretion membrane fusion protein